MNNLKDRHLLSLDECNVLKGIAIIAIFLHNFCHQLHGTILENEYNFHISRPVRLLNILKHPNIDLPLQLFSFFGHYGVPIFVFLSAFGLEMKYNNSNVGKNANDIKDIWRFSRYHFLKLFKLMFVGYITFLVVNYAFPKYTNNISPKIIIYQLSMIINFFRNYLWEIFPGPYWFFSLMMQLYLFYRLLLYKRHWGYTVFFTILFTILQAFFIPDSDALNYYRYNFMGSMLPFGLGILFARYGNKIVSSTLINKNKLLGEGILLIISILCIFKFSYNFYLWIIIPAIICIASICIVKLLQFGVLKHFFNILLWIGSISFAIFIAHPITRIIFIDVSKDINLYSGLLVYIMSTISLAWIFKEILNKIPNPKY